MLTFWFVSSKVCITYCRCPCNKLWRRSEWLNIETMEVNRPSTKQLLNYLFHYFMMYSFHGALFNVALLWCFTMWCCTILILNYLMLHYLMLHFLMLHCIKVVLLLHLVVLIKLCDSLITGSQEITRWTENIIATVLQGLWAPNLAGWWLMVTGSHPWGHMTTWLRTLARLHEKFIT